MMSRSSSFRSLSSLAGMLGIELVAKEACKSCVVLVTDRAHGSM